MTVHQDLLSAMKRATRKAAAHIIAASKSGRPIKSYSKADKTLVLNLDLECHDILSDSLRAISPIVSEEDSESHRLIRDHAHYLIIDPIDGTTSCKRFLGETNLQVGFGPMVGYVEDQEIKAVTFFNVPQNMLFYATRGGGTHCEFLSDDVVASDVEGKIQKLQVSACPLDECAVLFYAGSDGEVPIIERLKKGNVVENFYRFGGFANDCSRLARGCEQIQLQFSVKAWDLPAALLAAEAGLSVTIDPFGSATPLAVWKVREANPLFTAPIEHADDLLKWIRGTQ